MNIALRVRDVMSRGLITVNQNDEITVAVNLLIEHDISGVPVLDDAGELVGMLTERDCIDIALEAGYFDERGGAVAEYMSKPVETVDVDAGLIEVAQRLARSRFRRFPVLAEGRLVGLISRRDVLHVLNTGAWFPKPRSASGRAPRE